MKTPTPKIREIYTGTGTVFWGCWSFTGFTGFGGSEHGNRGSFTKGYFHTLIMRNIQFLFKKK